MSRGDIRIVDSGGRTANPVLPFYMKEGGATILAGEPVKIQFTAAASGADIAGAFYPVLIADNDPVGTTTGFYFLGIAAKDSTHTGTAAGTLDVYLDTPGTIYAAHPKTAGAANTASEISRRQFYVMNIDLTSSKFTIDDTVTHAAANGFIVVGGNADNDELYFTCRAKYNWRSWLGEA